jgi:methionyl-tRNA formyltransferase
VRVILAGSRSFGAAVFDMLLAEGHDVAAVWSPMDVDDALTRRATVGLWTPDVERHPKPVQLLEVDLFIAAHSHDFIGRDSRAATKLGGVGFHPSLLPRHRGRDAVRWAVHMGDAITGGSVYWLTDNVDGGPIAAQEHCFIRPGDDASSLWRRELFPMGVALLARVLRDLAGGTIVEVPQDESCATWEPSFDRLPLFRPELPQIGSVNGYRHIVSKERLHG